MSQVTHFDLILNLWDQAGEELRKSIFLGSIVRGSEIFYNLQQKVCTVKFTLLCIFRCFNVIAFFL